MDVQDYMPAPEVIAGIRDDMGKYEAERIAAQRSVRWRVPVFLGVFLAIVLGIALLFNGLADPFEQWFSAPHVILYVIAFIAAFFIYARAMKPATDLQESFRGRVLPMVFAFVKDLRYRKSATPDSFSRMPSETVGSFNRQSFDDVISGVYEDFPFELYETHLEQKVGKSSTTMFDGVIVAFEKLQPFPGVLVAARKTGKVVGFFRGLFGTELEEVQSGVAFLDETYEFRTDNVEAARPLVTGKLAQALTWLQEAWPEGQARVALKGSDGFLLLPQAKDFFELPSISVPLDYKAHIEPMVADMAALLATAALLRKAGARD
jgi:hypothetical protein